MTYSVITASTIFDRCPGFSRLPRLDTVACVQEVLEPICVLADPKRWKISSYYGPETDGFQFKLDAESMVSLAAVWLYAHHLGKHLTDYCHSSMVLARPSGLRYLLRFPMSYVEHW